MISRFFKRKSKPVKTAEKPKKTTLKKPKPKVFMEVSAEPRKTPPKTKKLLTAEGWKRLMMGKSRSSKK